MGNYPTEECPMSKLDIGHWTFFCFSLKTPLLLLYFTRIILDIPSVVLRCFFENYRRTTEAASRFIEEISKRSRRKCLFAMVDLPISVGFAERVSKTATFLNLLYI